MDIASRYAKALFQIEASEKIDTLLSECSYLMHDSPLFLSFLQHPEVSLEDKTTILEETFHEQTFIQFLKFLIQRKRFPLLPEIAQKYHHLFLSSKDQMEVILISATFMDEEVQKRLEARIEKLYQKKCRLKKEVDPQLIGGAILFIGNRVIDLSMQGCLHALKNRLLNKENRSCA